MKISILATSAVVLWGLSGCVYVHVSDSSADLKSKTNIVQTAVIPADLKSLVVDNRFGSIHVVGAGTGTAQWTWKLTVRARTDELAKEAAEAATCRTERDGDQLRLAVSLPDSKGQWSFQSDLDIRLPATASLHTRNHFGETVISEVQRDVHAEGQNGAVEIRHVGGEVHAGTSFATLTVSKTGPATLANRNGRIEASDVGGALDAETSFASLLAQEVAGAANLRNRNGGIEASDIRGPLEAKTSFATLTASTIEGPVKLWNRNGSVEVSAVKGDAEVTTSFARLTARKIEGDAVLNNRNGEVTASEISGSVQAATSFSTMDIASAGPRIACHNQNGTLRLRATSAALTNLEARTSFGSLEVRLPAALKPAIQARNSFGSIESDFPVLIPPREQDPFADVPEGTPLIKLGNQNGKIRVIREGAVASR